MEFLSFLFLSVVFPILCIWIASRARVGSPDPLVKYREEWLGIAETLHFTAEVSGPLHEWTMQGEVSGYQVRVQRTDTDHGLATILEVAYPQRLSGLLQIQRSPLDALTSLFVPDVEIGIPDFDANYRIQSTAPTLLRQLFADDDIRMWAQGHRGWPIPRLDGVVSYPQKHPYSSVHPFEGGIDASIRLVERFTDALDRFSNRLARRTGLTMVPEVARHLPRFEGTRDGVCIDLRQPETGDGLLLTATLSGAVDPTLAIVAMPEGTAAVPDDRVLLFDPILDAHVQVSTGQPEATRALLTQARVREDMLALMLAHPRARVRNGAVSLHVPTVHPDAVAVALDNVVALAVSLSAPRADRVSGAVAKTVTSDPR